MSVYYQPAHFLLQTKLFLRNKIAFSNKCTAEESISCTIFFLRLCCIQKQPFGETSETPYYIMRHHVLHDKYLKIPAEKFIFQLERSLLACNIDKNKLIHEYFSMILTTLQENLNFQKTCLQNILGWLLPCVASNQN